MMKQILLTVCLFLANCIQGMDNQNQIICKRLQDSPWPCLIRYIARTYHLPQGTIAIQLNKNYKKEEVEKYKQLNINLCMLANRRDISPEQLVLQACFLLQEGADPNYTTSGYKKTPLMFAVKHTQKDLVMFFLSKQLNCTAYDYAGWNARRFSLIYDEKQLKDVLRSVLSYIKHKLEIETHKALNPDDFQDYEATYEFRCAKIDSKALLDALYIDKNLADSGIPSPYKNNHEHPFIRILKSQEHGSRVRKAVRMTFSRLYNEQQMIDCFPSDIYEVMNQKSTKKRRPKSFHL